MIFHTDHKSEAERNNPQLNYWAQYYIEQIQSVKSELKKVKERNPNELERSNNKIEASALLKSLKKVVLDCMHCHFRSMQWTVYTLPDSLEDLKAFSPKMLHNIKGSEQDFIEKASKRKDLKKREKEKEEALAREKKEREEKEKEREEKEEALVREKKEREEKEEALIREAKEREEKLKERKEKEEALQEVKRLEGLLSARGEGHTQQSVNTNILWKSISNVPDTSHIPAANCSNPDLTGQCSTFTK